MPENRCRAQGVTGHSCSARRLVRWNRPTREGEPGLGAETSIASYSLRGGDSGATCRRACHTMVLSKNRVIPRTRRAERHVSAAVLRRVPLADLAESGRRRAVGAANGGGMRSPTGFWNVVSTLSLSGAHWAPSGSIPWQRDGRIICSDQQTDVPGAPTRGRKSPDEK